MPFRFHVPLPGPFSYSTRIGGKRRRRTTGPSSAESFAAAVDRGTQRMHDYQERLEGRHETERLELLARARRVAASTGDVYRAEVTRAVEHVNEVAGGTVQYASRSKKLTRLLDAIEAEDGATSVPPSAASVPLPPAVRPQQPPPPKTMGEHTAASAAKRRRGYVERIERLRTHGVDVTELDAGLVAMDAETAGSWKWTGHAEQVRRALKRAER